MPIITKVCTHCGNSFSGPNFSTKNRLFCSHACYAASRNSVTAGSVFGRLTAVSPNTKKRWNCVCECGNTAITSAQNLTSGKAKSCGCLAREIRAEMSTTHGASDTRAHNTWNGIIQRCTNKNGKQWADYGGRGIAVCEEWRDFSNFLRDMGQPPEGHSIERVDNSLGYSKGNCVWASRKEQQRNRRVNRVATIGGETMCITDWADRLNVDVLLVRSRLQRGWTELEALGVTEKITPKRVTYVRSDARWVEHGGRRMILADWCKELGLNPKTVYSRLKRGSTEREALGLS